MSELNQLTAMTPDEIRELLGEEGTHVSDEQAGLIARFVAQVGGLEQALAVLNELGTQSRAA